VPLPQTLPGDRSSLRGWWAGRPDLRAVLDLVRGGGHGHAGSVL